MKRNISIIFTILTQTLLFTSLLIPMSMPKHIGIGIALRAPEITIPIWLSETFTVEPSFSLWRDRVTTKFNISNFPYAQTHNIVRHNTNVKSGLGITRRFAKDELSFYIGIRLSLLYVRTREDYSGPTFDENALITNSISYFANPLLGAEYFFHKRLSMGGQIGVNLDVKNSESEYYDRKESAYYLYTNTDLFFRFYFK